MPGRILGTNLLLYETLPLLLPLHLPFALTLSLPLPPWVGCVLCVPARCATRWSCATPCCVPSAKRWSTYSGCPDMDTDAGTGTGVVRVVQTRARARTHTRAQAQGWLGVCPVRCTSPRPVG